MNIAVQTLAYDPKVFSLRLIRLFFFRWLRGFSKLMSFPSWHSHNMQMVPPKTGSKLNIFMLVQAG